MLFYNVNGLLYLYGMTVLYDILFFLVIYGFTPITSAVRTKIIERIRMFFSDTDYYDE